MKRVTLKIPFIFSSTIIVGYDDYIIYFRDYIIMSKNGDENNDSHRYPLFYKSRPRWTMPPTVATVALVHSGIKKDWPP